MLSTLKSMNTHPTVQQRQGALHIGDIVPKNGKIISIFEVHRSDPHFQQDLVQLKNCSAQARSFIEQGCIVSDLFAGFTLFVESPNLEELGITNRHLIAICDSKLAGFVSTLAIRTDRNWCSISSLGAYISKVGRSLMALIVQNEIERESTFIATQLPDSVASGVMRNGEVRKLPPLSQLYKQLGARKYEGEGLEMFPNNNVMVFSPDKIRALSEQYLQNITIHQEPESKPLSISSLYI